MSVVKVIRIIGNSKVSWAKAAAAAVREAARTVRGIQGVEATDFTGHVDDAGNITEYRCTVNIAFLIGGSDMAGPAGRASGKGGSRGSARMEGGGRR